jgi:hypothetical protein
MYLTIGTDHHRELGGCQQSAVDSADWWRHRQDFSTWGKLPVNTQLSGYYNVVRPDGGPNWQLRLQVQFMFPK